MMRRCSPIVLGPCLFLIVATSRVLAQGVIGTFAGTTFLFPAGQIPALSAPLGSVQDVALDSAGNLYISDADNHIVVRLSPSGALVTYAGNGLSGFSGDLGLAVNASMIQPRGLAIDSMGNLYIADYAGNRVRQVDSSGNITTYAGTGNAGSMGNGVATSTELNQPIGLAVDAAGNVYIADSGNNLVREVTPAGLITTFAGNGQAMTSGDGGPPTQAGLNSPSAVKVDAAGNVYIATIDGVRLVTASTGKISTLATGASLPDGLALDSQGNLYVSDPVNNQVVRFSPGGSSTIVAGNVSSGFSGDNGPALNASLNGPRGLAISASGVLYIADSGNLRVRSVNLASGTIATVAGNGNYSFSGDGSAAAGATFRDPVSVAINPQDPAQSLFIADELENRIREISGGIINTVAGDGFSGSGGDGGPATSALLQNPEGVAADNSGFYIADTFNNVVRKVNAQGVISTIVGGGSPAGGVGDGGPATQAQLLFPTAVATDALGDLYIADTNDNLIREVTPDQIIHTVAGGGTSSANGVSATSASLNAPQGVAVDSEGRIYIADTDNSLIRVVENGKISTLAGGGTAVGENVPATSALIKSPRGLAVDSAGNLYYSEYNANRVRRVSSGVVSTVAGVLGSGGFSGDGGPATAALLSGPLGLALDTSGNLYIADSINSRIRKVFAAPPPIQVSPTALTFQGGSGGMLTNTQLVTVLSPDLSGLPFTVSLLNNSPWLNVFPLSGTTPASLEVYADPSSLNMGTYPETIRISTPNADPPYTDVAVTFDVGASLSPPQSSVQPESLSFVFVAGSAQKSQSLTVNNLGGGTLTFTITVASGDFLSLSVASGSVTPSTPDSVAVTANPGSLQPGTYTGALILNFSDGSTAKVPVTMAVTAVPEIIRLTQTGLSLTAVAGGQLAPPQTFSVLNVGMGSMNWTAKAISQSGAPVVLTLDPALGTSVAGSSTIPSVSVSANIAGLSAGQYFNQVEVDSATALNSPQFIPVVLDVLPASQNPGPVIEPSALVFTGVAGASSPGSQNLDVYNLLGNSLNYSSQAITANGAPWIQYLPTAAPLAGDAPTRVVVQPNTVLLSPGIQQGVLSFAFDDGSARNVNVLAVVLAPPPGSGSNLKDRDFNDLLKRAQESCQPTTLVPFLTALGQGFVVPASYPAALIANVIDDCGNPMTNGSVSVSFSNGDQELALTQGQSGQWSGTWVPSSNSATVTLTLTAQSNTLGFTKTIQLSGGTRSSAPTPQINSGGIVNAANFGAAQPLAPGDMVSIFGTGLANGQAAAAQLPLGTLLAGTSAFIAGQPLPLVFSSPGQVNAILPYDLKANAPYQLFVTVGDRVSALSQPVNIAQAEPAIFQTSLGPAIRDQNGKIITASNPAHADEYLEIYAAGLGSLQGTVLPGTAPSPINTAATVTASIGNMPAAVTYAGLSFFAGLYQINVQVPEGIAPGDDVPLTLTIAGVTSPTVQISVQ